MALVGSETREESLALESKCALFWAQRLNAWNGSPHRLRSLLEMLVKLRANDIAWASCMLCQIVHIVERGEIPQGAAIDAFGGSLGALTRACEDLGLRVSLTQVQRLQQTIFTIGKMDWQTIG